MNQEQWKPAHERPPNGTIADLIWFVDGQSQKQVYGVAWRGDHWKGWWTPTHWRPLQVGKT